MDTEMQDIGSEGEMPPDVKDGITLDDPVEKAESEIEDIQDSVVKSASTPKMYRGNAYDITSLIALICGIGVLFLCLTCNLGFYFLPLIAIILGIVGILKANSSANPERTQLLSWLGIGGSVAFILISIIGIALYVLLLLVIVRTTGSMGHSPY